MQTKIQSKILIEEIISNLNTFLTMLQLKKHVSIGYWLFVHQQILAC